MCSRTSGFRRPFLLGLLLVVLGPLPGLPPLSCQETPPANLEAVGRRIEELRPQLDEASRLARLADLAWADSIRAANQLPQDTVLLGPFMVVAPAGQGELAREVFQPHVDELAPLIQGSEGLFRNHRWVFDYGWWRTTVYAEADVVHEVRLSRRYSRERLAERVRWTLGEALHQELPNDLGVKGWAQVGSLFSTDDWSSGYRELVSTPSLATQRCFAGDLRWCWEAVGLTDHEGDDGGWYSTAERRRLVESRYSNFGFFWERDRLSTRYLLVRGCLLLESDRACDLVLRGYPWEEWEKPRDYPIPLSGNARGTLVAEALRLGGPSAYSRLLSHPEDPIKDRLVYAAGVPPDTLMRRWRDKILVARPEAQAGLLHSPVSLAFWLILIIALAARSTRWRLG